MAWPIMSNGMLKRPSLPSCSRCVSTTCFVLNLFVSAPYPPPRPRTICCAPIFSTVAHALIKHNALISTLISFVTPAASPSTRRHSTAPISRPSGTKEPPRQFLELCQPHLAYARYARSNLHIRITSPSMREAAHTVSGSRIWPRGVFITLAMRCIQSMKM